MSDNDCWCGHDRSAHEHYRRGSDCALCGAHVCKGFGPARGVRALFRGPRPAQIAVEHPVFADAG